MPVRVEPLMGTVIGVDVRGSTGPHVEEALHAFFGTLRELDRRFSPWRPDSEISRIGRGELDRDEAPWDVRWVLAACDHLTAASGGAFDAWRPGSEHPLDPSGLVKGWAVDEAARHLDDAGIARFAVNAGGDVLVRGGGTEPGPWRVGIRHPDRSDRLAAVLELRAGAVATSGLYERGDHIVHPRTGSAPTDLRSLTVVGPELTWADAYATTGFAMGLDGLPWIHGRPGYGALAVTADDRLVWTPAIEPLLRRFSGGDVVMVDVGPNVHTHHGTLEALA